MIFWPKYETHQIHMLKHLNVNNNFLVIYVNNLTWIQLVRLQILIYLNKN